MNGLNVHAEAFEWFLDRSRAGRAWRRHRDSITYVLVAVAAALAWRLS